MCERDASTRLVATGSLVIRNVLEQVMQRLIVRSVRVVQQSAVLASRTSSLNNVVHLSKSFLIPGVSLTLGWRHELLLLLRHTGGLARGPSGGNGSQIVNLLLLHVTGRGVQVGGQSVDAERRGRGFAGWGHGDARALGRGGGRVEQVWLKRRRQGRVVGRTA